MVLDIVCGVVLGLSAIIGAFRGFTRQILKLFSWFVGIVAAFFLVKPVFEILMGIDAVKGVLDSLAGVLSFAGEELGAKIAHYIGLAVVFIVIWIVVSLVYKLIRRLITPISDLPVINVIDRILGLVFAVAIAAVILFAVIAIAYLLKDKVPVLYDNVLNFADDGLVKTYVLDNIETIIAYLKGIVEYIAQIKLGGEPIAE